MSTAETATEIRPFQVAISDEALEDLRRRIAATQWPEKETVGDSSQGVPLAPMQELAHYWATDYDWRKVEAQLHAVPQFMTEIDGLDIHFIHVNAASAEILLRRVRALPDEAEEAMLVGHNPGLGDLVLQLAEPGKLRDRAEAKVPTGALATLEADIASWSELEPGGARLVAFVVPRELKKQS
jgi:Epoxide hydrolase N terminus